MIGEGVRVLWGKAGREAWGRHSEVRDLGEVGEIEFEIMFKMPVAQPVLDLSYNFKKLVREQKMTGPSHTCTFFFPLLCLQPLSRFFTHPRSA